MQSRNRTAGRDIPKSCCCVRHASFPTTPHSPPGSTCLCRAGTCTITVCVGQMRAKQAMTLEWPRVSSEWRCSQCLGTWRNPTANSPAFLPTPYLQNTPGTAQLVERRPKVTKLPENHQETLRAVTFLRKGKRSLLNHAKGRGVRLGSRECQELS